MYIKFFKILYFFLFSLFFHFFSSKSLKYQQKNVFNFVRVNTRVATNEKIRSCESLQNR